MRLSVLESRLPVVVAAFASIPCLECSGQFWHKQLIRKVVVDECG